MSVAYHTVSLLRYGYLCVRGNQNSFIRGWDDLLVSGLVVLTSRTSVPTFTFIHFSHFGLRIFGAFGLSSSAFVELIVPVFSTKRIFQEIHPRDQILATNTAAHISRVLFSLNRFLLIYFTGLSPLDINASEKWSYSNKSYIDHIWLPIHIIIIYCIKLSILYQYKFIEYYI